MKREWAVVVVKWSVFSPSTLTIGVRIPLKPTVFSAILCLKKNKNKQKEAGVCPLFIKDEEIKCWLLNDLFWSSGPDLATCLFQDILVCKNYTKIWFNHGNLFLGKYTNVNPNFIKRGKQRHAEVSVQATIVVSDNYWLTSQGKVSLCN